MKKKPAKKQPKKRAAGVEVSHRVVTIRGWMMNNKESNVVLLCSFAEKREHAARYIIRSSDEVVPATLIVHIPKPRSKR